MSLSRRRSVRLFVVGLLRHHLRTSTSNEPSHRKAPQPDQAAGRVHDDDEDDDPLSRAVRTQATSGFPRSFKPIFQAT